MANLMARNHAAGLAQRDDERLVRHVVGNVAPQDRLVSVFGVTVSDVERAARRLGIDSSALMGRIDPNVLCDRLEEAAFRYFEEEATLERGWM